MLEESVQIVVVNLVKKLTKRTISPCDAIGDVADLSSAVRKGLQVRILPGVLGDSNE